MADMFPAFISALVSSSVAAAVVGVIFVRRNKQNEAEIKHHMDLVTAGRLIEHYDRWLKEYEKDRAAQNLNLDAPFIFVGPQGYPVPRDAEERFKVSPDRWAGTP